MPSKNTSAGIALLVLGALIGVLYPFLLFTLPPEKALKLLIATAGVTALAIGGLIGSIGLLLIRGIRVGEDENSDAE